MSSTTGGVVPPSAPPAPVGRRVAAYLVDAALTYVAAAPLWLAWAPAFAATVRAAAASGSGAPVAEPAAPSGVLLAVGAVLLAAWGVAQWVWNGTRGWTVGRRLLGLRLVDVRSGRPVGLGRAFVRALIVALGALACGVGQLVVLLSPLFDASGRRRGWHDRVGEGVVVDVRGLAPARRVADWSERPARAGEAGAGAPGGGDAPAWPGLPRPAAPGDALAGGPGGAGSSGGPGTTGGRPSADATPSEPTRTRWSALAADRRLDGPGLVLPPLGAPGLGPDLDTRQIPVVPAAVVPAHPAAPVPLAPGPDLAAPAAGPAAPAPQHPAAPAAPPAAAPWPAADGPVPAPGPAPAHEPAPGGGGAPAPAPAPGAADAAAWPPPAPAPVPGGWPHPAPSAAAPAPAPGGWPPPAPSPAAPATPAAPASGEQAAWRDALGPVPGPAPADPPTRTGRHAVVPAAPVHPDAPAPAAPPASAAPAAPPAPAPGPAPGPSAAGGWPPPAPAPHAPAPHAAAPAAPAAPATPPPAPFPAAPPAPAPGVGAGWAVRLPDGTVAALDGPLLVGRNPDPQDGVRTVAVADPGRSVSKTHLMLGVDEHGPWVVDRGSTNGTLVTLADGQRIVCLPDRRVRLADGSLVAFGDLALAVGLRA